MSDLVQVTLGGGFDYSILPQEDASFLQLTAERTRLRLKRTAEDIVAIGQELIEAQQRLVLPSKDGHFVEWLSGEFDMSLPTAYRFIHVAQRFGTGFINLTTLPVSVLYQLSAPSTPDAVVDAVNSGEIAPNTAAIKAAIADAKKARADAETAQQQLQRAQTTLGQYERDIAAARQRAMQLEQELADAQEPQNIPDPTLETKIKQLTKERKGAWQEIKELRNQLSELRKQSTDAGERAAIQEQLENLPPPPSYGEAFAKTLDLLERIAAAKEWQIQEWAEHASAQSISDCAEILTRAQAAIERMKKLSSRVQLHAIH